MYAKQIAIFHRRLSSAYRGIGYFQIFSGYLAKVNVAVHRKKSSQTNCAHVFERIQLWPNNIKTISEFLLIAPRVVNLF